MNQTQIELSCEKMKKEPRVLPKDFLNEFGKTVWIYDIEIYPNYALFKYRSPFKEDSDRAWYVDEDVMSSESIQNHMDAMLKFLGKDQSSRS